MSQELVEFRPQVYTILPFDTTDERLVELWLHDLAITTQESYQIGIRAFFAFVQKSLQVVNLGDLQQFADSLKAQGYKCSHEQSACRRHPGDIWPRKFRDDDALLRHQPRREFIVLFITSRIEE